ncbi:MAG TPA: PQQ-binding-like beta-propeller repeat protein [Bryobacteraceae bacterium]|nr:PQQ-binding-like beta-propeller repeat protein [Bryobacteraceae bacterium]
MMPAKGLAAFLWLSILLRAGEPDWPQFRGPDLNPVGVSKSLPDRWSTTENVEWAANIPGRGWSSPIVTSGKIFVTTAVTEGKSKLPQTGTTYSTDYLHELKARGLKDEEAEARLIERDIEMPNEVMLHYWVYCVDLQTGAVDWKYELYSGHPPGGRHRKASFTSETPITDGKVVYVYIGNLGLWAFDLKGKVLWSAKLDVYPMYGDCGTGASPALAGDQIIILSDNEKQQFIASYDKRSGKRLWRTGRDLKVAYIRSGWSTPFVWKNALRTEIVAMGPGAAVSYDLEGKELWHLAGMSMIAIPTPFAYDGWLYVDGGSKGPMFAVKPGASGDISLKQDAPERSNEFVVWSDAKGGTYSPTPVVYEGGLYVLNEVGILTRFDAKTGAQSYRQRLARDGGSGAFTSSPWAYNGRIFCLDEEGTTYVVKAGEKFEVLRVNSLDEMALATPAMAGDRLLLRTESKLYSIRAKQVWR